MTKRIRMPARTWTLRRQLAALKRLAKSASTLARASVAKPKAERRAKAPGTGVWEPGVAIGPSGVRRFRLYRPPDIQRGERLPLLVMLHGCRQDAESFAAIARRRHE